MPPTFTFVLLIVAISAGGGMLLKAYQLARNTAHAERMQRLKVLEEAMRNPATDAETRRQLIQALQTDSRLGSAWGNWLSTNFTPRRLFGALAWTLVVSGGVLLGLYWGYGDGRHIAIIVLAAGIGILALPHVMRELDARTAKH